MRTFKIGEIAKLFDIPTSTIRFWDDQGLIKLDRDPENGYRVITEDTLHDIGEVLLYRKMDVSTEEYREMRKMSLSEFSKTLEASLSKVENSIAEFTTIRNRLLAKLAILKIIDQLNDNPYAFCVPDIDRVISYHLFSFSDMQKYLNEPDRFALVIDKLPKETDESDTPLITHDGFIVPVDTKEEREKLWEKSETTGRFVQCLMKLERSNYTVKDLEENLLAVKKLGLVPHSIVGRFLAEEYSPEQDVHYEYYQAFIEVS